MRASHKTAPGGPRQHHVVDIAAFAPYETKILRPQQRLTDIVLRFRGSNHIAASINLVLRSAPHPEERVPHLGRAPRRIARVSKDGHKRDRASGHPSRRSAREEARRAPQDEVFETALRKSAVADLRT